MHIRVAGIYLTPGIRHQASGPSGEAKEVIGCTFIYKKTKNHKYSMTTSKMILDS